MSGGASIPQGLGKYPTLDPDLRVERNVETGALVGSAILAGRLPVPLDERWGGALGVRGSLSIEGDRVPGQARGKIPSSGPIPHPKPWAGP